MTDRSITECYFSNPIEYKINVTNNCANEEGTNKICNTEFIDECVRESVLGSRSPVSDEGGGKVEHIFPQWNCSGSEQSYVLQQRKHDNLIRYMQDNDTEPFVPEKESVFKDVSLKYGFTDTTYEDFAGNCTNPESSTHIENIFNEKQPFGDDDSLLSFNDHITDSCSDHIAISGTKQNVDLQSKSGNVYDGRQFLADNNSVARSVISSLSSTHDGENNVEATNNASNLKNPVNQSADKLQKLTKMKPFLLDNFDTDLSSRPGSPGHRDLKPIKATYKCNRDGSQQHWISKSSQDISALYYNDVREFKEECQQIHNVASLNSSSSDDNSDRLNEETGKNIPFGNACQSNTTSHSNRNFRSLPTNQNFLNKSKSISLNSLPCIKKKDYSHVQSKVKLYIQNLKQKNLVNIETKAKSLPNTPSKFDEEARPETIIELDEKIFEKLRMDDDDLPENLKLLKSELCYADDRGVNFSETLLESLIELLREERKCRFDQDITLNHLQLNYDNLLVKYEQAKDVIDKLRIYRGTQTNKRSLWHSDSLSNLCNGNYSSFSTAGTRTCNTKLKKALSTSSLFFANSEMPVDIIREENLVKYSSTPIVDPDIVLKLELMQKESGKKVPTNSVVDKKSKLLDTSGSSNDISSSSNTKTSPVEGNFARNQWMKEYEELTNKFLQYSMLEGNSAFQSRLKERQSIWNYLIGQYNRLVKEAANSANNVRQKRKLKSLLEAIQYLSTKYDVSIDGVVKDCSLTQTLENRCEVRSSHSSITDGVSPQHRHSSLTDGVSPRQRHSSLTDGVSSRQQHSSLIDRVSPRQPLSELSVCRLPDEDFSDSNCQFEAIMPDETKTSQLNSSEEFGCHPVLVNKCSIASNKNVFPTLAPFKIFPAYETSATESCMKETNEEGRIKSRRPEDYVHCANRGKDIDSGCPLSDRSTAKYSQCCSTEQPNSLCNTSERVKHQQPPYKKDIIDGPRNINRYCPNTLKLSAAPRASSNGPFEDGYEASSSSHEDDSDDVCRSVKRHFKIRTAQKKTCTSCSNISNSDHSLQEYNGSKYEEKYVIGYESRPDVRVASKSSVGVRSHMPAVSKLKKNSDLFKAQMDSLKGKHWSHSGKDSTNDSTCFHKIPVKPIDINIQQPTLNERDISRSEKREKVLLNKGGNINIHNRRVTVKQRGSEQSTKQMSLSPHRKEESCIVNGIATSDSSFTTTPGSHRHSSPLASLSLANMNYAETIRRHSLNPEVLHEIRRKSTSVPSLVQPLIYIEQYTCQGRSDEHNLSCGDLHSKICVPSLLRSSHADLRMNKRLRAIDSLDEVTSLAESIRLQSSNVLKTLRKNSVVRRASSQEYNITSSLDV